MGTFATPVLYIDERHIIKNHIDSGGEVKIGKIYSAKVVGKYYDTSDIKGRSCLYGNNEFQNELCRKFLRGEKNIIRLKFMPFNKAHDILITDTIESRIDIKYYIDTCIIYFSKRKNIIRYKIIKMERYNSDFRTYIDSIIGNN